jgi:hypothetical protein
MLQAESSSALLCLWTARSLPAAPHPVSRRRSCLPLRTDQCFCPMGTFTPLLVRTLRRTSQGPSGRNRLQIRQARTTSNRHSGTQILRQSVTLLLRQKRHPNMSPQILVPLRGSKADPSIRPHAVTPRSSAPGCANRLATVVRRAPAASSERDA